MAGLLNILNIEMRGTAEEAEEGLEAEIGMEVEVDGEDDGEGEGDEEGDGTSRALGDLEFLTQDAEPSGTTLVYDCNGFNKLICLEMLWTMHHHWPAGQGPRSIAIGIGHSFYSDSWGSRQSQF